MAKRSVYNYAYYFFAFTAVILSTLVYCYLNNYFSQLVFVHTEYGSLQGFAATSRDGRTFYQFSSVPYAKAPLGRLRFQPPVPMEPWEGVKDATRMTPLCPQYDLLFSAFRGQEDCLFLNIFTPIHPGTPQKELLPVMIFLHGGLFMFGGSGEFYGARYWMDEPVIFISVNYRLGLLGFLNTGDNVITGNQGLKDQLEAFKFIKKVIRNFGGDPNKITIVGESAGGSSVHYHMLSPQSKGYFQRAISQSGSAFCPWAFSRTPREQSIRLGNQVECPTNNSEELANCLISLDVWELIKPHKQLADVFIDPLDVYGPSVENVTSPAREATAFLVEYPYKLAAEGKTHAVPWISGVNSHEGCFRSSWFVGQSKLMERLTLDWGSVASAAFFLHQNDTETLHKVRKYHFGESDSEISESDYEALTNLVGDRCFVIPARDAAVLHAKHHKNVPTYLYYFTERGDQSYGDFMHSFSEDNWIPRLLQIFFELLKKFVYRHLNLETFDLGACHADELNQMMSFIPTSILDITSGHRHYEFSKNLIKLWVQFAKDGDPGEFRGATWEKLTISRKQNKSKEVDVVTPKYLLLSAKKVEMISEPFHHRLPFWHEIKLPRNLSPEQESSYNYDVMK